MRFSCSNSALVSAIIFLLCNDNLNTVFPFLEVGVRQVFKGGNYFFFDLEIVANSNTYLPQYFNFLLNKLNFAQETIQGRKLLIIRRF